MEGTWNNGGAAYRCRHGHSSANSPAGRTPNAHIRESHLLARMPLLHIRLTANRALPTTAKGPASAPAAPNRNPRGRWEAADPHYRLTASRAHASDTAQERKDPYKDTRATRGKPQHSGATPHNKTRRR